jgi:hypothetical protein
MLRKLTFLLAVARVFESIAISTTAFARWGRGRLRSLCRPFQRWPYARQGYYRGNKRRSWYARQIQLVRSARRVGPLRQFLRPESFRPMTEAAA